MRGEIHIADVVLNLRDHNLLPAIVFRTSRQQCDQDAEHAANHRELRLSREDQEKLRQKCDEVIRRYEMDGDLVTSHPQYGGLISTGVAAHHAGQLLVWRLLLEELMAAGVLRTLVATGTVAAGVDFPARTVVITAHSKRGAEGFSSLTAAEFQQMSGRAGRRGRDTVGFCIAAPAPFCDARTLLKIAKRPPEPLVSAYFPGPSTVLNLLRYRNVDDLRYTVQRSLAGYIDRRTAQGFVDEANDLFERLPRDLHSPLRATLSAEHDQFVAERREDEADLDSEASVEDEVGPVGVGQPRETKKLIKRIRRQYRRAHELRGRQVKLLDAALDGLRRLGYLDGLSLSPKGFWAANLCTNIVLELAQVIEAGMFEGASAERLVAVVSAISGDEHRRYLESKNAPISKADEAKILLIMEEVERTGMPGLSSSRTVSSSAAYTVLHWMHTEDWHAFRSILLLSGVAEGDAARLITQTAEHLNQLTRLSDTHPQIAFRAEEAKRRILRPPLTEVLNLETV